MAQETTELELVAPSTIESLERASVDMQITTAKRYPRSLTKFKSDVLSAVTLDAEVAESCIYYRPVGKKKNEQTGQWEESYAEGPSIRMAEIVAASYGNIRAGSRTLERSERFVKAQGVCHDLEKNVYAAVEVVEATVKKDGTPYDERLRVVIEKAALAKAYRDAVFKVVPRAFLKSSLEEAKRVAAGEGASLEQRRQKVLQWLQQIRMPEARVFAALGVKGWSDIGVEQLTVITGLKTAIKDGEISTEEAFPLPDTDGMLKTEEKTPEQATTAPSKTEAPTASPQVQLQQLVETSGFDWPTFKVWAEGIGQMPEGQNWSGWDAVPEDIARRILRAKTGLKTGLAAIPKGGGQ